MFLMHKLNIVFQFMLEIDRCDSSPYQPSAARTAMITPK